MKKNSWLLFLLYFTSCDFIASQEKRDSTYSREFVPYDLLAPTEKIDLTYVLEEISGLAWYNGNIACVNDEDGEIFIISTEGEIQQQINFGSAGDYEGIAVAGKDIFVIKSNGDIYKFSSFEKKTEEFDMPLAGRHDVEGLTFNAKTNSLLIANKDDAGIDDDIDGRGFYSFDIKNNRLSKKSLFVVHQEDVNQRIIERESGFKIREFAPSGIAIHPQSGNIYIISHRGKALVVLDEFYNVLEAVRLSSRVFKQPEGICFSPDGTLYISNEGRGGVANFLIFAKSVGEN